MAKKTFKNIFSMSHALVVINDIQTRFQQHQHQSFTKSSPARHTTNVKKKNVPFKLDNPHFRNPKLTQKSEASFSKGKTNVDDFNLV